MGVSRQTIHASGIIFDPIGWFTGQRKPCGGRQVV
jgi:hypothetical protein